MLIYLASPYSHPQMGVRAQRFEEVCRFTGEAMNAGFHVFSPIAMMHSVALRCALPGDWTYWEEYDRKILTVCGEMWVACLPGWKESNGVGAELGIADQLRLPVRFFSAGVFNLAFATVAPESIMRQVSP